MPQIDMETLYAAILTITNVLAIGGAAALLLFPRHSRPGARDDGSSVLNMSPEPGDAAPEAPSAAIRWSSGASPAYTSRNGGRLT